LRHFDTRAESPRLFESCGLRAATASARWLWDKARIHENRP
jgi:hypothetical protein